MGWICEVSSATVGRAERVNYLRTDSIGLASQPTNQPACTVLESHFALHVYCSL